MTKCKDKSAGKGSINIPDYWKILLVICYKIIRAFRVGNELVENC